MIGYATVGTDDVARAGAFYDALLVPLGGGRVIEETDFIVWAAEEGGPMFSVHRPADGKPQSVGNGVMIALRAASQEQVRELHRLALSLGGADEGAPGLRNEDGFYAAYFRDLEGNKLNAHCFG